MAAPPVSPSEGPVLALSTLGLGLAGWDLTDYLIKTLTGLGHFIITIDEAGWMSQS